MKVATNLEMFCKELICKFRKLIRSKFYKTVSLSITLSNSYGDAFTSSSTLSLLLGKQITKEAIPAPISSMAPAVRKAGAYDPSISAMKPEETTELVCKHDFSANYPD